ncbi:MAG: phage tail protein, partial [Bradyrhizobium sp.]|nr:phage tail protein [Bradyrhizobium sp.]
NSIQGAQNQANKWGPVPVVLGTMRQSPFYAANPYTEIIGNDQYVRMVFCLGYGPLAISNLQIGETPLASFSDYAIEIRQGFASDAPVTLYTTDVEETDLSVTLDNTVDGPLVYGTNGIWNSQFTAPETETISLDFSCPNGMSATDPSGSQLNWYGYVNVQYRLVGAASFTSAPDVFIARNFNPARVGISISVASGQYEVRCRKATGNGVQPYAKDQIVWSAIRSFKAGKPISFPQPLALIALRIRATNQLSGVIATLNCITTSLVNAYNGTAWVANQPSQNPADLFRYVLQGPANARPVADAAINLSVLESFWSYCNSNGFKYNEVITSSGSVYDKLCDIAAAGRAVPVFIDGQWAVVWDRPADPIVQHFTPRNSWGMQGQRTYAQQPHGWRVAFTNELMGYAQDERIVYDDGYSELNATLFEQVTFPGITHPDLIWRHGRFHIAQVRLRPEKISLNVGWEHLICTRGDRVRVTHDVLLIGLVAGRVLSVAGQVVTFDEVVTIASGQTYGVSFRIAGASATTVQTNAVDPATAPGEYTSLTLVGDLSAVVPGALFAFGETAQESADYRVQGISHQKDLVATLTLVDDAPDISTADSGAIPAYTPNITIPPDPLTLPPVNLQYSQVIDGSGQNLRALVRLAWQVPRFGSIASFEVQSRDDDSGGDWQRAASVLPPATQCDVPLPV